jgi:dipeptidyl aminopeptidase/acylaminoacyl peptidase
VFPRTFAAAAVCLLGACTAASGIHPAGQPDRQPPIIPIEQLFGNPQVADAQLSPDGRWLAYRKEHRGRLNVYARPLAGGPERLVTRDTVRAIPFYRWSADGARILYLQDRGGDEAYHLFVADVADTAAPARDLTPFRGVEVELIAAPARTPDTVLLTLNRRDPRLADAYRLDLATGALEMAAENPGTFLGYAADAENRVRAAYALDSLGRYSVWTRETEARPWRMVTRYPVQDRVVPMRFHPDGRRLYASSNHGGGLSRLVLIDLRTGEESVVDEDPLGEADLEMARFDERTGELLATTYVTDTLRIYPKVPEMTAFLEALRRTRPGAVELGTVTLDRTAFVATVTAPTEPGATYLWRAGSATPELLHEPRPGLRGHTLAQTRPIRYRTSDGLTIHGYLTLPPGRAPRGLPLVLLVHGGPWDRDRWHFNAEVQLLANRGYAVLQANYRGSTGFGKRFAAGARKEFARAMHRDLLEAVDWAVAQGYADRWRVAIVGGSYGGYAALVGLTFTPEVFACAVDYSGPSNLVTLVESFPPSWGPWLPRAWYPYVGDPRDPADRADMLARSPLQRMDSARAPLLIFQGANDPRVTREQSDRAALALHRRGIPVTYLLAGAEGHGWGNHETALAVNRATETFLAQCLGGRVQPQVSPEVDAALRALTVDVDTLREPVEGIGNRE